MVSTIGIISLSSGIIGEDFVKHEVDLGIQRLKGPRTQSYLFTSFAKRLRFYQKNILKLVQRI